MGLPGRCLCHILSEAGPGSHSQEKGFIQVMNTRRQGVMDDQFRVCPPCVYRCSIVPHSRSIYQDISTNIRAGSRILMPYVGHRDMICLMAITYKCWRIQDFLVFVYFMKILHGYGNTSNSADKDKYKGQVLISFPIHRPPTTIRKLSLEMVCG